ncbi:hypothetical protein [Vulcanisaeta distributa]|nr:hypothetical protein [Vulcanisaeta distributa]
MGQVELEGVDEVPLKTGLEWVPEEGVEFKGRSGVDWHGGFCEGMVYDVLAYYKPYTHNRDWGIYYVVPSIANDLERLIETMYHQGINEELIALTVAIYPSLITIHEVCHHTLENVRRLMGLRNIYESHDEGLCEYTAFKLIEGSGIAHPYPLVALLNPLTPMDIHFHGDHIHVITRFGDFVIPFPISIRWRWGVRYPLMVSGGDVRRALTILYKWWGRGNDPIYRPRISNNYTAEFLRNYWLQLRGDLVPFMDHALTNKPVKESLWTKLNTDDKRISIITKCGDKA